MCFDIKAVGGKSLSAVTETTTGQKLVSLDNNYTKEYNRYNNFVRHISRFLSEAKFAVGVSPYGRPQTLVYPKLPKMRFKKSFLLPLLFLFSANFAFGANCHCIQFIEEWFMERTDNDLTRQIKQMNIDQSNFANHFVNVEMVKGLENELKGVLSSYNKLQSTMQDYDEMRFLSEQLIKELGVTNQLTTIEIKQDMLKKDF